MLGHDALQLHKPRTVTMGFEMHHLCDNGYCKRSDAVQLADPLSNVMTERSMKQSRASAPACVIGFHVNAHISTACQPGFNTCAPGYGPTAYTTDSSKARHHAQAEDSRL